MSRNQVKQKDKKLNALISTYVRKQSKTNRLFKIRNPITVTPFYYSIVNIDSIQTEEIIIYQMHPNKKCTGKQNKKNPIKSTKKPKHYTEMRLAGFFSG